MATLSLLRNIALTSLWAIQVPEMFEYVFEGNLPLMYVAMVKRFSFRLS